MYVRDTLPDSGREKGRSSTGGSDGHRNTQYHKSYLEKQLLLEKEKLLAIENAEKEREGMIRENREEGEGEGEGQGEEEEEEYRGNERGNEAEVGSDIQFSVSISNIYDTVNGGMYVSLLQHSFTSLFVYSFVCLVSNCLFVHCYSH